jgi:hypothetical protein
MPQRATFQWTRCSAILTAHCSSHSRAVGQNTRCVPGHTVYDTPQPHNSASFCVQGNPAVILAACVHTVARSPQNFTHTNSLELHMHVQPRISHALSTQNFTRTFSPERGSCQKQPQCMRSNGCGRPPSPKSYFTKHCSYTHTENHQATPTD